MPAPIPDYNRPSPPAQGAAEPTSSDAGDLGQSAFHDYGVGLLILAMVAALFVRWLRRRDRP